MKTLKLITAATLLSVAVAGTAVAQSAVPLNTTTTTQAAIGLLGQGMFAGYTAAQLVAVGFVVVGTTVFVGSVIASD